MIYLRTKRSRAAVVAASSLSIATALFVGIYAATSAQPSKPVVVGVIVWMVGLILGSLLGLTVRAVDGPVLPRSLLLALSVWGMFVAGLLLTGRLPDAEWFGLSFTLAFLGGAALSAERASHRVQHRRSE